MKIFGTTLTFVIHIVTSVSQKTSKMKHITVILTQIKQMCVTLQAVESFTFYIIKIYLLESGILLIKLLHLQYY